MKEGGREGGRESARERACVRARDREAVLREMTKVFKERERERERYSKGEGERDREAVLREMTKVLTPSAFCSPNSVAVKPAKYAACVGLDRFNW